MFKKLLCIKNPPRRITRHDGSVITLIQIYAVKLFKALSNIAIYLRMSLLLKLTLTLTASLLSGALLCDRLLALAKINSLCDKANNLILKVNEPLLVQNSENYK